MGKSVFSNEYGAFLRQLKQSRKDAGLTQAQLARRLGQTQSFVSKCERGERRIEVVELRGICSAMEVSFSAFIAKLDRDLSQPLSAAANSDDIARAKSTIMTGTSTTETAQEPGAKFFRNKESPSKVMRIDMPKHSTPESFDDSRDKRRPGRPKGAKSRYRVDERLVRDLVETKLKLAEVALDKLKEQLRTTADPDERARLLDCVDDLIGKIEF